VNNDLERMRKEAAMACFKVLSQQQEPRKTRETSVMIGCPLTEIEAITS